MWKRGLQTAKRTVRRSNKLVLAGLIAVILGLALIVLPVILIAPLSQGKNLAHTGRLEVHPLELEASLTTGWKQMYPLPEAPQIKDIAVVDAMTAWVTGEEGIIMRTTDGSSWKKLQSGTTRCLNCISAVDGKKAWAAGAKGVVLKTVDGGSHWDSFSLDVGDISHISATGESTVWMLSPYKDEKNPGRVIKTSDAGKTWEYYRPDWVRENGAVKQGKIAIGGIYSSDANTCWALGCKVLEGAKPHDGEPERFGDDVIMRTEDGGTSWRDVTPADAGSISCYCVPEEGSLWISSTTKRGAPMILRTEDGGMSWSRVLVADADLYDMCSAGPGVVWLLAKNNILVTKDNGVHWETGPDSKTSKEIFINLQGGLSRIAACDSKTAWIVNGGVFKTDNEGLSWDCQIQGMSDVESFNDVSAANESIAWFCNAEKILITTDGGETLQTRSPPQNFGSDTAAVWGINDREAWYMDSPTLSRTTDAAETWLEVDDPPSVSSTFDAIDGQVAWAVQTRDDTSTGVFKTDNGGKTWFFKQLPGTCTECSSISAVDGRVAWVAARDRAVVRSIDGGRSWGMVHQPDMQSTQQVPSWVSAVDANHAVLAGNDLNAIEITEDGGASWATIKSPASSGTEMNGIVPYELTGIKMLNRQSIWVLARSKETTTSPGVWFLMSTRDGGATWQNELVEPRKGIQSFDVTDRAAWVVGDRGLLMRKGM
ncbi:MAG: WD40/YVTN/BNR-like repeat-containing protein [Candidatus Geothermincolia bacterium]